MSSRSKALAEAKISPLGLCAPPPLIIECDAFSGSLSTLFTVVRQHKIDLLGVPLLPICQAYFLYMLEAAGNDLESSATALVALAYLLERKAWLLLPSEAEPEMDAPLEIEPNAYEYEAAIETLQVWQAEREQLFFRSGRESGHYEMPMEIGQITPADLARAFESLLARAQPDLLERLAPPRRSLSEQMGIVFHALSSDAKALDELMVDPFTRNEAVWWFLALLELIRVGQASAEVRDGDVFFSRGKQEPKEPASI